MKRFDTKVQYLKYKVLREVAHQAWQGTLYENLLDIPKIIVPTNTPTMRCCVYKERAILAERVKIATGGRKENPNVIEVIDTACDECPVGGFEVTNACRGCLAHHCEDACRFGAISFNQNHEAQIDKTKCKECGACAKVCPYTAIVSRKRPCQSACKVKAITMDENRSAEIDNSKCISCGACVYMCPFGAIMDKSYIINVVDMLKKSGERGDRVYAVIAPAFVSQFSYVKPGQVVAGLTALGFHSVVEVALGADIVAQSESAELAEKGFLTSSCCPAFVGFIHHEFPDMVGMISHNPSPMAAIARFIKKSDDKAKVVFIGPCTAKKTEAQREDVKPYVDAVMTFEELQALFDSRDDLDITTLEEEPLDGASYYGRILARSGGLTAAVEEAVKEQNLDIELKPSVCNGIEECKVALLKKSKNLLDANFIEGMACIGGCIGGAGCVTHGEKNKAEIDKFGKEAQEQTILGALSNLEKQEQTV